MRKRNCLLLLILMFSLMIPRIDAVTIRETMDSNDSYSTLEEGSIIIGATKFLPDTIVTASRAATAGANDAMLYVTQNGNLNGYETPGVYYYIDPYVGWFFLDSNNQANLVTDEETLDKLSKLDIYYVDNKEKVLEIEYSSDNIDLDTLPAGVEFRDNKLLVNATIQKLEFMTNDQKKVSFVVDPTTSSFVEDTKFCYQVSNGIITKYDSSCGNEIVIPTTINDEKITGIGDNAFKDTNIVSVIIPNEIKSLGNNVFSDNNLESVVIKDKYDERDFSYYGDNVFGEFDKVVYDNELTRILSYVDDEIDIKYYKDLDLEIIKDVIDDKSIGFDYIFLNLIDIFNNNGYDKNFTLCYENECNYEEHYIDGNMVSSKDLYGVEFVYLNDGKYVFSLNKYDVSEDKVYNVSKLFNINLVEIDNKDDYDAVNNAIQNLKYDDRSEFVSKYNNNVTRIKYLEDLEDLYDIDIMITNKGYESYIELENDVFHLSEGKIVFCLKDGILYNYIDPVDLVSHNNKYVPSIYEEEYENIDEYVDVVLEQFSSITGVDNYSILYTDDKKIYGEVNEEYEKTGIPYNIELIDNNYSEKWTIEFVDYYEDQYDENGYTKEECFEFYNGVIIGYDKKCGSNVRIPNKIDGINVIEIDGNKEKLFYNSSIRSVTLPPSLKKIGNSSFANNRIEELVIPNSVVEIGYDAFINNKIKNLVIPNSVVEIGSFAFANNEIENLALGNELTEIAYNLFDNNKIKNLVIPDKVKKINENAFSNNEIESVFFNDCLEVIDKNSFMNNKIRDLKLPNSLKEIKSGSFTNNLLPDEKAFVYGRKLDKETNEYVIDYENLTSYGGKNRDNVVIPSDVKIIQDEAFYNLGIKKITLPYGLKEIGESAIIFNQLTELTVPDTVEVIKNYAFDCNYFEGDNSFIYARDKDGNTDYTSLVRYSNASIRKEKMIIPSQVKKIWSNAFPTAVVDELVVPYGVEEIGDRAFSSLEVRNMITLPKSVKKLGYRIFNEGESDNLDEGFVYAREEDGTIDKSILMGYKLYIKGGKLILPEGIVEIRENVFNRFYMDEVVLPTTLEKIGDMAFKDNYGLTSIDLPDNLKEIGEYAFENTNIWYVKFNDKLEVINKNAFNGIRISRLNIPSNVKVIEEGAFANIYTLSEITLNEGLEIVGKDAFADSKLTGSVTIPSSVTTIGDNAFGNKLSSVYILGKSGANDFINLGEKPFGNAKVTYEKRFSMSLNKSNINLFVGDSETLKVTITPEEASDMEIKWQSSNPDVATVVDGKVTAVGTGVAIITATVNGYRSTCTVRVDKIITYDYEWVKIDDSCADEYYLYIVSSEGNRVSGHVNITYNNGKSKEHDVSVDGLKLVHSSVTSVEIISIDSNE